MEKNNEQVAHETLDRIEDRLREVCLKLDKLIQELDEADSEEEQPKNKNSKLNDNIKSIHDGDIM